MNASVLLAVLSLVVVTADVAAQTTQATATFLFFYKADSTGERERAEKQLADTADGFSLANAYLKTTRKQEPLYCSPDTMKFTGKQMAGMLIQDVWDHPESRELPVGLALLQALQRAFPCP
jgi:hypothetical protein